MTSQGPGFPPVLSPLCFQSLPDETRYMKEPMKNYLKLLWKVTYFDERVTKAVYAINSKQPAPYMVISLICFPWDGFRANSYSPNNVMDSAHPEKRKTSQVLGNNGWYVQRGSEGDVQAA